MRSVDLQLVGICVGSTVAASMAGGLSIALLGTDHRALGTILGGTALVAAGVNLLLRRRDEGVRRRAALELENILSEIGADDSRSDTVGASDPEFAGAVRAFEALNTRVREEAVARQVGNAKSREVLSVLHSLSDPVFVFDRFGSVRLANTAASDLFPVSESLEGMDIRTLFDEGVTADFVRTILAEGSGESRSAEVELEVPGFTGEDCRVYDIRSMALSPESAGGFLLSMRDLTRERQISRMKSDFVSKASHELRTPLASIRAYLEMLVDGEAGDEESQAQFLESMLDDTERLSGLVENMLNISRIEAGMVRPRLERTDLGSIAEHVAQVVEPMARDKDIQISVIPAPMDLTVEGDATMLEEALLNLASNAVKYTPEGGRVTITVDTDSLEKSVLVGVSDTGLGIPADAREHVFEKFYRVPSYERMAKGTGLGLNLCRNIVESVHRGRIGVDSTMGAGSRFWFTIPMGFAGARAA